jgi:hypothetical protein
MQSVPTRMYEAMTYGAFVMAIVAFAMGIVALFLGLMMMGAFGGKSLANQSAPSRPSPPPTAPASQRPAAQGAATTRASTRAAIAKILGGGLIWLGGAGLIWLGLHYGFEFQERLLADKPVSQPVQDKLPVAPLGVPSG